MAKCKFCGKPVKSALVLHAECLEDMIHALSQEMCDNYCRFPRMLDGDDLVEQCCMCPLVEILEMGGQA